MPGTKSLQLHVQETLGCPAAAAAAAVLLTPIKRCMDGAAGAARGEGARGGRGAPAGARRSGPACRRRAAGKARPGSPGPGAAKLPGAVGPVRSGPRSSAHPPAALRSPGGVRAWVASGKPGWQPGRALPAGLEPLLLASPSRAPPPPPPPPPHSSPRGDRLPETAVGGRQTA